MKKDIKNNSSFLKLVLKTAIIEIVVSIISILFFSVIMFLCEMNFQYSSLFATISVAIGLFVSTYIITKKRTEKGFLTGLINGFITFIIILIISFIKNSGSLTYNTFFHLIIFLLAAAIGGILGVNKNINKKYI